MDLKLFPRFGQFYFQNSLLYHVTVQRSTQIWNDEQIPSRGNM